MTVAPDLTLSYGSHNRGSLDGPCCLVEAEVVHVLHRDTKADSDPTICPVIQQMATGLNDSYPNSTDGDRTRTADLSRFLGQLSGTKSIPKVEEQRSLLALDWLVRVYTPAWLRLVPALVPDAVALETAHRIDSLETASEIGDLVRETAKNSAAAWDAAWAAAGAAAGAAAWDAAGAAAGAAAWDAAGAAAGAAAWAAPGAAAGAAPGAAARDAAWDAAWAAAWAAAWDAAGAAAGAAAWDAARAAAGAALNPTAETLRASAIDLLDRMIAVTE